MWSVDSSQWDGDEGTGECLPPEGESTVQKWKKYLTVISFSKKKSGGIFLQSVKRFILLLFMVGEVTSFLSTISEFGMQGRTPSPPRKTSVKKSKLKSGKKIRKTKLLTLFYINHLLSRSCPQQCFADSKPSSALSLPCSSSFITVFHMRYMSEPPGAWGQIPLCQWHHFLWAWPAWRRHAQQSPGSTTEQHAPARPEGNTESASVSTASTTYITPFEW